MTSRIYSPGTVSIASGSTTATFAGAMMTTNVMAGDVLSAGGLMAFIKTVTDDTHAELETAWSGSTLTGAAYVIGKFSWDRYDPAITQAKARELLAALAGISIDPATEVMSFDYGMAFPATVSPPQITANQNNWTIASFDDAITFRVYSDAARTVTGLAGGTAGRFIIIQNIGSYAITFSNESASSLAANRFAIGTDLVLGAGKSAILQYDVTSSRWRSNATALPSKLSDISGLAPPATNHNAALWHKSDGTISQIEFGPGAYNLVQQDANGKLTAYGIRETLSAARTYYVRTDGSDSNDGLTNAAGGAFLTIQKAIDKVAALDLGIYNATIQVADGTYSGSAVLKPVVGAGKVYLIGNVSSPQNCVISGSTTPLSNLSGTVAPVVGWYVKGFELRTSGGGGYTNVYLTDGASVTFDGPMRLGSNNGIYYGHIYVEKGAKLSLAGQALTVAASGPGFLLQTAAAGQIDARNAVISWLQNTTYTGTIYATWQSSIAVGGVTWTLNGYTITTTYWRYCAGTLSIVDSNGGGASFIPGSAAGIEQNNGKYL